MIPDTAINGGVDTFPDDRVEEEDDGFSWNGFEEPMELEIDASMELADAAPPVGMARARHSSLSTSEKAEEKKTVMKKKTPKDTSLRENEPGPTSNVEAITASNSKHNAFEVLGDSNDDGKDS